MILKERRRDKVESTSAWNAREAGFGSHPGMMTRSKSFAISSQGCPSSGASAVRAEKVRQLFGYEARAKDGFLTSDQLCDISWLHIRHDVFALERLEVVADPVARADVDFVSGVEEKEESCETDLSTAA